MKKYPKGSVRTIVSILLALVLLSSQIPILASFASNAKPSSSVGDYVKTLDPKEAKVSTNEGETFTSNASRFRIVPASQKAIMLSIITESGTQERANKDTALTGDMLVKLDNTAGTAQEDVEDVPAADSSVEDTESTPASADETASADGVVGTQDPEIVDNPNPADDKSSGEETSQEVEDKPEAPERADSDPIVNNTFRVTLGSSGQESRLTITHDDATVSSGDDLPKNAVVKIEVQRTDGQDPYFVLGINGSTYPVQEENFVKHYTLTEDTVISLGVEIGLFNAGVQNTTQLYDELGRNETEFTFGSGFVFHTNNSPTTPATYSWADCVGLMSGKDLIFNLNGSDISPATFTTISVNSLTINGLGSLTANITATQGVTIAGGAETTGTVSAATFEIDGADSVHTGNVTSKDIVVNDGKITGNVLINSNSGTVMVKGASGKITGNVSAVAPATKIAKVTVNSGEISGLVTTGDNSTVILEDGGTMGAGVTAGANSVITVNEGTITGAVTVGANSAITVDKGTITGAVTVGANSAITVDKGTITGVVTFIGTGGTLKTVNGGKITGVILGLPTSFEISGTGSVHTGDVTADEVVVFDGAEVKDGTITTKDLKVGNNAKITNTFSDKIIIADGGTIEIYGGSSIVSDIETAMTSDIIASIRVGVPVNDTGNSISGNITAKVAQMNMMGGTIEAGTTTPVPIPKVGIGDIMIESGSKISLPISDTGTGNIFVIDSASEISGEIIKTASGNIAVQGTGSKITGAITAGGTVNIYAQGGTISGAITKTGTGILESSGGGHFTGSMVLTGNGNLNSIQYISHLGDTLATNETIVISNGVRIYSTATISADSITASSTTGTKINTINVKIFAITNNIDIKYTIIGETSHLQAQAISSKDGSITLDNVGFVNTDGTNIQKLSITTKSTGANKDVTLSNLVETSVGAIDNGGDNGTNEGMLTIGVVKDGTGKVTVNNTVNLPNATIVGHGGEIAMSGTAHRINVTGTGGSGFDYDNISNASKGIRLDADASVRIIDAAGSHIAILGNKIDFIRVEGYTVHISSAFTKSIKKHATLISIPTRLSSAHGVYMDGTIGTEGEYTLVYAGGNLQPRTAAGVSNPKGKIGTLYYGSMLNDVKVGLNGSPTGGLNLGAASVDLSVVTLFLGGDNYDLNSSGGAATPINLVIGDKHKITTLYLGGSGAGNVVGTPTYNMKNTVPVTIGTIYGGGNGSGEVSNVDIKFTNGTVQNVFGGGAPGSITTDVKIAVVSATGDTMSITGNIYGGGHAAVSESTSVGGKVTIDISKDVLTGTTGRIYGGGLNDGRGSTVNETEININLASATATFNNVVYGGGKIAGATVTTDTTINVVQGTMQAAGDKNIVFGGGDNANVGGNATVVVSANAVIDGVNIYGGGNGSASVKNTFVEFLGTGKATSGVFGGGYDDGNTVTAATDVKLLTGTFAGNVYGGGNMGSVKDTAVSIGGLDTAAIPTYKTGAVTGNVYAGALNGEVSGTASVIVATGTAKSNVTGNVYGGGHSAGAADSITPTTADSSTVTGSSTVTIDGEVTEFVYGGGHSQAKDTSVGGTSVTVGTTGDVTKSVYGGGHAVVGQKATVGVNTLVTINGNAKENVYGGGRGQIGGADVKITGNTVVNIVTGTVSQSVYGGGHADVTDAVATNGTHVVLAKVTGTTGITIDGTVNGFVYGGGLVTEGATAKAAGSDASVTGKATVLINAGTEIPKSVFGGGHAVADGSTAKVNGGTSVTVGRDIAEFVYGGGHAVGAGANTQISGGTEVETATAVNVKKDVYGGGYAVGANSDASVVTGTKVEVNNLGTVGVAGASDGYLYGGGHAVGENSKADVYIKVEVATANTTGSVYGGGFVDVTSVSTASAQVQDDVEVKVNGTVGGNAATDTMAGYVYGGGRVSGTFTAAGKLTADVSGSTNVLIGTGAGIPQSVFGGGHAVTNQSTAKVGNGTTVTNGCPVPGFVYGGGNAVGDTTDVSVSVTSAAIGTDVTISGAVTKSVYGGGHAVGLDSKAQVATKGTKLTVGAEVTGSVYGGGHGENNNADVQIIGNTAVTINANGTVQKSVFGGGHADGTATVPATATNKIIADVAGKTVLTIDGNVTESVYGGGYTETLTPRTVTASTADVIGTGTTSVTVGGTVSRNVYGGGFANAENTTARVGKTTLVTVSGTVGTAGQVYSVYGGGLANVANTDATVAHVDNTSTLISPATTVIVNAGKTVHGNVYGGGHITNATAVAIVDGFTGVTIKGTVGSSGATGFVYGGGYNQTGTSQNARVVKDTNVLLENANDVKSSVYGGGRNAAVTQNTNVTMKNGTVGIDVFGGGHGENQDVAPVGTAGANKATVKVESPAKVKGNVYGAGHGVGQTANLTGSTDVEIDGTVGVAGSATAGFVYGGGYDNNSDATVSESTDVKIATIGGKTPIVEHSVFGGGRNSAVAKNTKVTMLGGTVAKDIYGGGHGEVAAKVAKVGTNYTNSVNVLVDNGKVKGSVYGGGYSQGATANADVAGKTVNVNVQNKSVVSTDVFGGSRLENSGTAVVGSTASGANTAIVKVAIYDSTVTRDVFGGSKNDIGSGTEDNSRVRGKTEVLLDNGYTVSGTVYGGGLDSHVDTTTKVDVLAGKVSGEVFGGGYSKNKVAKIGDKTVLTPKQDIVATVLVDNKNSTNGNYSVVKSVYGGGRGRDADLHGSAIVTVASGGRVDLNVFGAGRGMENATALTGAAFNNVRGYAQVDIHGTVGQNAYGGGQHESYVIGNNAGNSTKITVHPAGIVNMDVYGGGHNSSVTNNTLTTVEKQGTVGRDVYGGTVNDKEADSVTYVVGDSTRVYIHGKVGNNVYGAGWRANTNGANGANVTVTGWVVNSVYGGGRDKGLVLGTRGTDIDITATAIISPTDGTLAPSDYHAGYAGKGNVYGGGSNADVVNATGKGSNVTVYAGAQVAGVVFGGGESSDVIANGANGGTDVKIYGRVGVVHGGGKYGKTVDTTKGSTVLVSGRDAIVYYYVFGGGLGKGTAGDSQNLEATVRIEKGSEVKERVFGGGKTTGAETTNTTDVTVTDAGTVIGHREIMDSFGGKSDTVTGHLRDNLRYTHEPNKYYSDFDLRIDRGLANGSALGSFNNLGAVYGGGDHTSVGKSTNVVIDPTGQMVFDIISGGNIDVISKTAGVQIPRTITINNLGSKSRNKAANADIYTDLGNYGVIRMLMDYTETNANNSYMAVYYHLDGYDNGKTMADKAYSGIVAQFNMRGGVYMPWKPQQHTDVRVEPFINMHDSAMFRIEYGYSIELISGIYSKNVHPHKDEIQLLIDLEDNPGSTTKIFAPNGNLRRDYPFSYTYLPSTLVSSLLLHSGTADQLGLNIYIPPQNVNDTDGDNTNTGGSSSTDSGTGAGNGGTNAGGGSFGGGGGGGGGGGAAGGGGGAASTSTKASTGYSTSSTTLVKESDAVGRVTAEVKKAGAGKTAVVTEKKAGKITGDTLRAMQLAATKAGGKVLYYADTVRGNKVEGRMQIDPAKAANIKGEFLTTVFTSKEKVSGVAKIFQKFYKNKIVIVRIEQEGNLGMEVKIAALVDLKELNTKTLQFYAYSTKTNNYIQIKNPRYTVDANGYLHFYTSVGGHIVVTDQPLAKK